MFYFRVPHGTRLGLRVDEDEAYEYEIRDTVRAMRDILSGIKSYPAVEDEVQALSSQLDRLEKIGKKTPDSEVEERTRLQELAKEVITNTSIANVCQDSETVTMFIEELLGQMVVSVNEGKLKEQRQRQMDAIAIAKAKNLNFGRPATPLPEDFPEIVDLWSQKKIPLEGVLERCHMSTATFYRRLKEYRKSCNAENRHPSV